ncbi:MAG: peptidoglycan DD-metalloendopeptidase family protein [Oscillospiraceae bacterium]|jgi:murein DD-endopeptidase MepM/ murein hydrolase activator NlpD|nr:peptidoglycan DD-metalloendopeptidase family protein [Oscillospiraceae bacterium]
MVNSPRGNAALLPKSDMPSRSGNAYNREIWVPQNSVFLALYRFCYFLGMYAFGIIRAQTFGLRVILYPFIKLAAFIGAGAGLIWKLLRPVLATEGKRFAAFFTGAVRLFAVSARVTRKYGMIAGTAEFFRVLFFSFKRHRDWVVRRLNYAVPLLCILGLIGTVNSFNSVSYSLKVVYNGQTLGFVRNERVFTEASDLFVREVRQVEDASDYLSVPQYSLQIVGETALLNSFELRDKIAGVTRGIQPASGLYVDGSFVAAMEQSAQISAVLDGILDAARTETQGERVAFSSQIAYDEGLYPVEDVVSVEMLFAQLATEDTEFETVTADEGDTADSIAARYNLSVQTLLAMNPELPAELVPGKAVSLAVAKTPRLGIKIIKNEIYTQTLEFAGEEIRDGTKVEGYRKVQTSGKNGEAQITAEVSYINGVEISRNILETKILSEPVNEKVVIGTKTEASVQAETAAAAAAQARQGNGIATGGTMFFPVADVLGLYVSTYFGAGRSHKGWDIAAPGGTDIYAADGGTVVAMNPWPGGYGLHFVVDHGNGIQTLYAHCRAVYVTLGQKVTRGQGLAAVGSTGNSTGNHLHFEVRVNGTPVNPADWLILKQYR